LLQNSIFEAADDISNEFALRGAEGDAGPRVRWCHLARLFCTRQVPFNVIQIAPNFFEIVRNSSGNTYSDGSYHSLQKKKKKKS